MAQSVRPMKEGVGGVGFALLGLHLKSLLLSEWLTIPRTWPTLGGSAKPQMLKHKNTWLKRHMVIQLTLTFYLGSSSYRPRLKVQALHQGPQKF